MLGSQKNWFKWGGGLEEEGDGKQNRVEKVFKNYLCAPKSDGAFSDQRQGGCQGRIK